MSERNLLRYERKFILNSCLINNKQDLENFISRNLYEKYNSRRVNSIYYDTNDFKLYKDSLDGIFRKDKIRVRYYGSIKEPGTPKLEIKSKYGHVGKKFIINLNYKELYKDKFLLIKYAQNKNFNNTYINTLLMAVKPKILLTYNRNYFLSECNRFRFTLDKNICFKLINTNISPDNFDKNLIKTFQKNILELKYISSLDMEASLFTKKLPSRLISFSKYTIALNYLGLLKL